MKLNSEISCGWIGKAGIPGLTITFLLLGLVCALLAPLLLSVFHLSFIDFVIANLLFLLVPLFLMLITPRQLPGMGKWTGGKAKLAKAGLALLYLAALGLNIWCLNAHVCRAGHMAHSPYPLWHSFLDVLWPSMMYAVVYILMRKRLSAAPLLAFLSTVIVVYRFYL